jgi:hypothetical protein
MLMDITKNHYILLALFTTLHISSSAASFTSCMQFVQKLPARYPIPRTILSACAPQILSYAWKQSPLTFKSAAILGGMLSFAGYQYYKPSSQLSVDCRTAHKEITRARREEKPTRISYFTNPAKHLAAFGAGSCIAHPAFIKFCTDSVKKHPYVSLLGTLSIGLGLRHYYHQRCMEKRTTSSQYRSKPGGGSDSDKEQTNPGAYPTPEQLASLRDKHGNEFGTPPTITYTPKKKIVSDNSLHDPLYEATDWRSPDTRDDENELLEPNVSEGLNYTGNPGVIDGQALRVQTAQNRRFIPNEQNVDANHRHRIAPLGQPTDKELSEGYKSLRNRMQAESGSLNG